MWIKAANFALPLYDGKNTLYFSPLVFFQNLRYAWFLKKTALYGSISYFSPVITGVRKSCFNLVIL